MAEPVPTPSSSYIEWFAYIDERDYRWKRSRHVFFNAVTDWLDFMASRNMTISQSALSMWRDALVIAGFSASTCNSYLSAAHCFVEAMRDGGVDLPELRFRYVPRPNLRKWWLTEADRSRLFEWLHGKAWGGDMMDYILFVCETGLRVEEVLRMTYRRHIVESDEGMTLEVPGTKTEGSAIRVPLSNAAALIVMKRRANSNDSDEPLFSVGYDTLRRRWQMCRKHLGELDTKTATLKSLRRSFAANCMLKGLPVPVIQELMRHTSIRTTMLYLRLVGLVDNAEVRQMLNRKGFGDGAIREAYLATKGEYDE